MAAQLSPPKRGHDVKECNTYHQSHATSWSSRNEQNPLRSKEFSWNDKNGGVVKLFMMPKTHHHNQLIQTTALIHLLEFSPTLGLFVMASRRKSNGFSSRSISLEFLPVYVTSNLRSLGWLLAIHPLNDNTNSYREAPKVKAAAAAAHMRFAAALTVRVASQGGLLAGWIYFGAEKLPFPMRLRTGAGRWGK